MANAIVRAVRSVCAGLALLATSSYAAADISAVLTAAADTNIYSAVNTRNGGASPELLAGRIGASGACSAPPDGNPNVCSALRRALLRFDLSAIPAGSQITSASLQLAFLMGPETAPRALSLRRLTQAWAEGTGGATPMTGPALGSVVGTGGGVTWAHANHNVTDWVDGGASLTTISATQIVGSPAQGSFVTWSGATLTADVQSWVASPANNFGWVLRGDESVPLTMRRFASRETTIVSQRPRLTVSYKLANGQLCSPNGPNTSCISGVCTAGVCGGGSAGLTSVFDATADANIYSAVNTRNGGAARELLVGRIAAAGGCAVPGAGEPNVCSAVRRALLRFNVASLPAGSQITNAWVQLAFLSAPEATARALQLRRLTANWVEGAGGGAAAFTASALGSAVATGGGVTWIHANHNTTNWADGGAFIAAPSATVSLASPGAGAPVIWSNAQLAADVQAWLSGSANNFGWVLSGDEVATTTIRRFASRESLTPQRPRLFVTYKLASGRLCSPNGPNATCISGTCASGVCN